MTELASCIAWAIPNKIKTGCGWLEDKKFPGALNIEASSSQNLQKLNYGISGGE